MESSRNHIDRGYLALLAILLFLGLWIIVASIPIGFGSIKEVGAGVFPALVGGMIVMLTIANLARARSNVETVPSNGLASRRDARRIAAIILMAVMWILLLPFLGYILDTFVVTFFLKKVFGTRGWVEPVAQGVLTTIFVFALFDIVFYIDLPRGFLF